MVQVGPLHARAAESRSELNLSLQGLFFQHSLLPPTLAGYPILWHTEAVPPNLIRPFAALRPFISCWSSMRFSPNSVAAPRVRTFNREARLACRLHRVHGQLQRFDAPEHDASQRCHTVHAKVGC